LLHPHASCVTSIPLNYMMLFYQLAELKGIF